MRKVHVMTIRLMGPDNLDDDTNQEAVDDMLSRSGEVEELFNATLPEGYYVKAED